MKLSILLLILFSTLSYSQSVSPEHFVGKSEVISLSNGQYQSRVVTTPEIFNPNYKNIPVSSHNYENSSSNNSMIRWTYIDAVAIGDRCETSGSGLYEVVGWGLNNERVSLYGNSNNTPFWEYSTMHGVGYYYNNVAISDTGGYIAAASYRNIYIFNRTSGTPIFNFDLNTLSDPGVGTAMDITSNGRFIVTCNSRSMATDSSTILGFWKDSTNSVWRYKVGQTVAGGPSIQGIKMSGNDSLVIVNTYGGFYVFRTYTGQLVYQGLINPSGSAGTQAPQGISGNGSVIATINYNGFLRVYQWNGSTYNFLWQHQEPPGTYYNWMTAVDITYDGSLIACGTLNFITSSTFDGKVKLFRTANGSTPLWTYTGMGDEVGSVSFSRNGNVLTACSWGDFYNPTVMNLLVFKVSTYSNIPIFGTDSPGSFFWCSTSNDGSTVVGSGKRVHARQFGNGGQLYNIYIDTNDVVGIQGNIGNIPGTYALYQNYPNPFNPSTQINYDLPLNGNVKITVFDILGKEIEVLVDNYQNKGKHSVVFDAGDLSSGLYFYKLEARDYTDTKKMILLK